jgi:hypothetical protein
LIDCGNMAMNALMAYTKHISEKKMMIFWKGQNFIEKDCSFMGLYMP